jgi:Flp pilus assembly protein TadG
MRSKGEPKPKLQRSERGQSLTELAISFVVLVLLLAVVVDGGRLFFSYIAIREAAEEGAVYGSLNPTDNAGIIQRVRTNSSQPVDLSDTTAVNVVPAVIGTACADGINQMQVTVTYTFDLTMPFLSAIIGTNQFPLALDSTSTILLPECP